jgi:cytosine/uracil/thiamine/allantoin permease
MSSSMSPAQRTRIRIRNEAKTLKAVSPLWAGLHTYAWFISIGLSFLLYAGLMPAMARMAAPAVRLSPQ